MRRSAFKLLCLAVVMAAVFAFSPARVQRAAADSAPQNIPACESEHRKFEMLAEEYDSLPVPWPDHSRPDKDFEAARAVTESVTKRLKTDINYKNLDDHDWVAYYVLRAKITERLSDIQDWREQTKRVAVLAPSSQIVYEMHLVLFNTDDKAAVNAYAKMATIPAEIEKAKAKIKDSNPGDLDACMRWLERDYRVLESTQNLDSPTVPGFKEVFGDSFAKAMEAVKSYREMLDKSRDKWPKPKGDGRLGEEKFSALLRNQHLEFRSPKELSDIARAHMAATRAEMEKIAQEIDKTKTLAQILDEMKSHHPDAAHIASSYQQILTLARNYVVKKDIVTIPKGWGDNVRVERFIDKDRWMPYAFYQNQGGDMNYFMSSGPFEGMKKQEFDEKLAGHSYYSMFTVTVHETFPGHHLQFAHAAQDHRVPRIDYYDSFFSEGWGLYCEEMMGEQGFYEKDQQPKGWDLDPRKIRLAMLRWRLHRAARVIIDVGLQTQKLSHDDAMKLMVEGAFAEQTNARAEVNRFERMPTQPMSYLIGYLDLMKLREDYKKMKGDKFNLKEFHEELLSYGSVPIILVRGAMLHERDKVDAVLQKN